MNTMIRSLGLALTTVVLLHLAGCVTPGGYVGDSGNYGQTGPGGYGQPAPGYPSQYGSRLQGTVESIDPGYSRIVVFVDDPRSGRGQRTAVRYDQRTRLSYQGRQHPVQGLERGDVISMEVAQSGRELWAQSIELLVNARDERHDGGYGGDGYDNGYGNELSGSVAFVDTRSRSIRLDGAGYGNNLRMTYDNRTIVVYQGRSYRPENLQRGDMVRVQARQLGNNQWLAERIFVVRSVGR